MIVGVDGAITENQLKQDRRDKTLIFPDLVFGRNEEFNLLDRYCEVVRAGEERIVFIKGLAGAGKSAFINFFFTNKEPEQFYFFSGKYDQYRDTPLSALALVLAQIADFILSRESEEYFYWQHLIEDKIGEHSYILSDLTSQWEKIIVRPKKTAVLTPREKRSVLLRTMVSLFSIFSSKEKPFVFFLDDLQWMDDASRTLLNDLFSIEKTTPFLFIGAYREDEIDEGNLFSAELTSKVRSLRIDPLDNYQTQAFLQEILNRNDGEQIKRFSKLVFRISGGFPLQIKEFLRKLHQEKLLFTYKQKWEWNWDAIFVQYTEQSSNLILDRVETIDNELHRVLLFAAALGTYFSSTELSAILESGKTSIEQILAKGIVSGFIMKIQQEENYQFIHDTIRQSFYSLVPEKNRKNFHLLIARKLEYMAEDRTRRTVFELAFHYNQAAELLFIEDDMKKIIRLNFKASEAAFSASAWKKAFEYAGKGIGLLQLREQLWWTDYAIALKLMNRGVEVAFLCGEYKVMEHWISSIEKNVRDIYDTAFAWKIVVQSLVAQRRLSEAVTSALDYCHRLGLNIRNISLHLVILRRLTRRAREVAAKPMWISLDSHQSAYIDIFSGVSGSSYIAEPDIFYKWAVYIMRHITVKGLCYASAFAYLSFGVYLIDRKKYNEAYTLGELGFNLSETISSITEKVNVYTFYALFIIHIKKHLSESLPIFQKGYETGYTCGDFEFASICLAVSGFYRLIAAMEKLSITGKILDESLNEIVRLKQKRNSAALSSTRQLLRCIQGKTYGENSFDDGQFCETEHLKESVCARDMSHIATFYFQKTMDAYLFLYYKDALEYAVDAEKYLKYIVGQAQYHYFFFLYGMTLLALSSPEEGFFDKTKILKNLRIVEKMAEINPVNYQHRRDILQAEFSRVNGNNERALKLYTAAEKGAETYGSFYDRGIINERTADFFKGLGFYTLAEEYICKAYMVYSQWEAFGKTKQLERLYYGLISRFERRKTGLIDQTIDVYKFTDFFSSLGCGVDEAYLENVLFRFLDLVIRIAYANKAVFLEIKQGRATPVVMGKLDKEGGLHIDHSLQKLSESYSNNIVNYVLRTGETIFEGPDTEQKFPFDPYIRNGVEKGYVCFPVILRRTTKSVLYLELDHLKDGIPDRNLELLEMIATQTTYVLEREQLLRRQQEIEKLNREQLFKMVQADKMMSMGLMIAEITHDLNNPNHAILLHTKNLRDMWRDIEAIIREYCDDHSLCVGGFTLKEFLQQYPRMLETIETSSEQLNSLVVELRKFITPSKQSIKRPVDINSVIEATNLIASHLLKKATINYSFSAGAVPRVLGDRQRLQQVILNLIKNSCDSLSDREESIAVTTFFSVEDNTVVVEISDEGCGIEPDLLASVTEPFFSTKNGDDGMGMGLYICKSIIEEHRGMFNICSTPDKGTAVRITLPAAGPFNANQLKNPSE